MVNIVLNRNEEFPNFYTDLDHIGELYHSYLKGDRDFLIVASIYSHSSPSAGFYSNYKNTVQGIGEPLYDIADRISDDTVLQGITNISHSFIIIFKTINHELLHRWATFLYEVPNLEGPSWHRYHWDIIQREESGFGESGHVVSKIEKVSDSTYQTTEIEGTNNYYNDLELYLMGLAPFSEIESPIETLVNPQKGGGVYPYYLYTTDSTRYIDKQEILDHYGQRIPDFTTSQKNFSAAFIVVSDRVLSNFEIGFFDYLAKEYEKEHPNKDALAFEDAAMGLATISTNIGDSILEIEHDLSSIPQNFSLNQNFPNPFNPLTTIQYSLNKGSNVEFNIYNIAGQLMKNINIGYMNIGSHDIQYNSKDLSSGIYFYQLIVNGVLSKPMKMTVLK